MTEVSDVSWHEWIDVYAYWRVYWHPHLRDLYIDTHIHIHTHGPLRLQVADCVFVMSGYCTVLKSTWTLGCKTVLSQAFWLAFGYNVAPLIGYFWYTYYAAFWGTFHYSLTLVLYSRKNNCRFCIPLYAIKNSPETFCPSTVLHFNDA